MPEEARLWQRWQVARDDEARALLLAMHLPYARVLAAKCYAGRRHEGIEFEDYLQCAQLALIESLERYDPSLGTQFRTFAHRRIAGAIFSGLEALSERQQQLSLQKRLKAGRGTLADASAPAHSSWLRLAERAPGLALADLFAGCMVHGEDVEEIDDVTVDAVALQQFRGRLPEWLRLLTDRERQVIKGHYLHAASFDALAKALGISNARVTQLHRSGLARLREVMARTGSREEWR